MTTNRRSAIKDHILVRQETVSPAEYLRISKQSPHLIARSRFVPPRIGEHSFGSFEIQYSVPLLRERAA